MPRDTTGYTPYYNKVANAGLMYTYAFRYVDNHRNELKRFKDTNSLLDHLRRQSLLKDFTTFAETKGIKLDIPQIIKSANSSRRHSTPTSRATSTTPTSCSTRSSIRTTSASPLPSNTLRSRNNHTIPNNQTKGSEVFAPFVVL